MKYKEIYDWGVHELETAGIEECALDARLLLENVCHTNRNDLLAHGEREVEETECRTYFSHIAKRKGHMPLQYITGLQDFMGLTFEVNEHVLIPRQDTEVLAEEVMRFLHDGMDILDMCTGSGCILLSLLHYSNRCTGIGADVSKEALQVAERNGRRLLTGKQDMLFGETAGPEICGRNLQEPVAGGTENTESEGKNCRFVQSDLFENISGQFDIIVSNPPYIPAKDIPGLMAEVREHEPLCALDGKEDGLYFYREIVPQAGGYLRKGGYLFFEIGCEQAAQVRNIMEKEGFRDVTVVKDFAGLDRVVYGWK